jgi:hypothetical protein
VVQRGGSADKAGNAYEALWTVLRMTQLLDDSISSIRFEPPGVDGAEFLVMDAAGECFDQVKFRSGSPWSVHALIQDGVLGKLANQYAAGARVQLVLSNGSPDFERLISKAGSSQTLAEFQAATTTEPNVGALAGVWQTDAEGTFQNLKRTSMDASRPDHLRQLALLRLQSLVTGSANTVCALLESWAAEAQQQTVTGPILWNRLEAAGHPPQPKVGDPVSSLAVRRTFERYLSAVTSAEPAAGVADRVEVNGLISLLEDSTSSRLIVVHGRAGAGKSSVAAAAASYLATQGAHVAAVRLDGISPHVTTAEQLGDAIDLIGSPAVVLNRLAPPGSTSVLLIDQLDAVSQYSGRMPHSFSAVDELVRQAHLLGNVRVLLVSRTVDLEHDQRIRRLIDARQGERLEIGDLADSDISSFLRKSNIDPSAVDGTTLELLRLPIQLSVFSRLSPENQLARFDSLTQLYAAFSHTVRSRLSDLDYRDEWEALTRTLVERMSEDEALSAPELALDPFDPKYVNALVSENILILEHGRFRFFHETFFDFVFALRFKPRGDALVAYFVSAGRSLLRRAQLRQVLAFIATDSPRAFVSHVLLVLNSAMRAHLKPIALSTLISFDPAPSDWDAIASEVRGLGDHVADLLSLLSRSVWFAAADSRGDVAAFLDDDRFGILVARTIADGAAPLDRVVELLASRASRSDEWAAAHAAIADRAYEPGLVDFAVDGVLAGIFGQGPDASPQIPWRLFHTLREEDPAGAIRVLGAYLRRLDLAAVAAKIPVALVDPSNSLDQLQSLAEAEPALFVDEVLTFIVGAAKPDADSSSPFGRWEYRTPDRMGFGFEEEIFYALDRALECLPPSDPASTLSIVSTLSAANVNSLDFLACRMLKASGLAAEGIRWLLEKDSRLQIGWSSSARWESRRLIATASSSCPDDDYFRLENKLLEFVPEWERMADPRSRANRGYSQLELLSALPADRLSPNAATRILELKRKFPWWSPSEPEGIKGGSVNSPVAAKDARKMSDANWKKAIDTHIGDNPRYVGDEFVGGARELAQTFGTLIGEDPDRYLQLALSLDSTHAAPYLEEALRQSAGSINIDGLTSLCLKLRREFGQTGSRAISFAIGQRPEEANDELVDLLIEMTSDDDPLADRPPTVNAQTGVSSVDYSGAGLNSARGGAASAMRAILFAQPGRTDQLLPSIVKLSKDPTLAVRAMAAEATLPVFNSNLPAALDVAEELSGSSIELYKTRSLVELLRWSALNDPDRFAPFVARALKGPNVRAAGSVWFNLFVRDSLRAPVTATYADLAPDARFGVAESLRHVPERALELACEMFDDPSADVRKEAAMVLRCLDRLSQEQSQHLVERFLDSASFGEHSRVLFTALNEDSQLLPTRVLEACERFVTSAEVGPSPDTADYQVGLVIEILLRLYHQGGGLTRTSCLDQLDRLATIRVWGLERALRDER